jgi:hypothetical protein
MITPKLSVSGYHHNELLNINTLHDRCVLGHERASNLCCSVSCMFCQYCDEFAQNTAMEPEKPVAR